MGKFNRCVALAAGLLIVVASATTASAQARPAAPAATPSHQQQVAVIDLSKIFKNYARFTDLTEDLRKDAIAAQASLQKRGETLQADAKRLNDLERGSRDFKILEEKLAKTKTSLDVDVKIMRKRLAEQESKAYYDVYQEIKEAIAYYANRRGYTIVLRFNSMPINPNDLAQVQQGVMRTVIYQQGADITNPILQMLQQRYNPGTKPVPDRTGNVPGRRYK